jgi:hypothetical protein
MMPQTDTSRRRFFLRYGRTSVTGCRPQWSMPTANLVRPLLTGRSYRAAQSCICAMPDAVENFAALR